MQNEPKISKQILIEEEPLIAKTGETLGRLSDSHRIVYLEDGVSLQVRH